MAYAVASLDIGGWIQAVFATVRRRPVSLPLAALLLCAVPPTLLRLWPLAGADAAMIRAQTNLSFLLGLLGGQALQLWLVQPLAGGLWRSIIGMGRALEGRILSIVLIDVVVFAPLFLASELQSLWLYLVRTTSAPVLIAGVLVLSSAVLFSLSAVMASEGGGLRQLFLRWGRLTLGNRWRVRGVFLLTLAATLVLVFLMLLAAAVAASLSFVLAGSGQGAQFAGYLVVYLWPAPIAVAGLSLVAELRNLTEGPPPEEVATLFG